MSAEPTGAPRRRPHWAIFAGLAIAVGIADQLLKAWVVATFDDARPTELLGDWLRIAITQNSGALFGLFRDQAGLFALFSLIVVGGIVWFHGRAGRQLLLSIALGLLLGGAIGNLVDRIRLGYVVDFVDMGIGAWRFYTYNIADAAITTSIVMLIVLSLFPGFAARLDRDA